MNTKEIMVGKIRDMIELIKSLDSDVEHLERILGMKESLKFDQNLFNIEYLVSGRSTIKADEIPYDLLIRIIKSLSETIDLSTRTINVYNELLQENTEDFLSSVYAVAEVERIERLNNESK
jgi:hypothetical protein